MSTLRPRAVPPEPVPGLGITWVDRGFPYWRRRIGWSLFYLLVFAVGAGGSAGFIIAFLRSDTAVPVRVILVAISGCVIVGSAFFTLRWVSKQEQDNGPRPRVGSLARNLASGGGPALRMIVGTLIGGLALICLFYLVAGGWLVMFLLSLRRVLPDEARARRRFESLQALNEPLPQGPTCERHPRRS